MCPVISEVKGLLILGVFLQAIGIMSTVIPFIQCPLSMLRLVYGRKIQYVLLMIHFLHSGNCDKSQKNEMKAVWLSSLSLNTEY